MSTGLPIAATFRVRTLMIATAAVAVGLWLKFVAPEPVGFLAFWALALIGIARGVPNAAADPMRPVDRVLFPALLAGAAAAEWWGANLAYHTLGEIDQAFHALSIGLNLPAIGLLLGKRRRWAYAWIAAVFLWLVPYQVALLGKWTLADREARGVVAYLAAQKAQTGVYPADLSGYAPASPLALGWLWYKPSPKDGFVLGYHLGTPRTAHTYRPSDGWFYYPD